MPPSAAKVSGVAKTSIEAIRLAVKTWLRLSTLDCIAAIAEPAADDARSRWHRQPTRPPPLVDGDDPDEHGDHPDHDRPQRRASMERRDRDQEGDHAQHDPDRPDGGRVAEPRAVEAADVRAHAAASGARGAPSAVRRRSFRRAFQTARIRTSAPTKSTTSPWIISVRWPARLGSITPDWRPCVVPKSSAAEEERRQPDAEGRVPAEQRDRDPEEADRLHLDVGGADLVEVAEHVEPAREAGERAGDRHRPHVVRAHLDSAVARPRPG